MNKKRERFQTAVEDGNWLEPAALYLGRGYRISPKRPVFQGDVFDDVPLPSFPSQPPSGGSGEVEWVPQLVMVVPHPCQCYNGDKLRDFLTVAPVKLAQHYSDFGQDLSGDKDKFPLPDLVVYNTSDDPIDVQPSESYVASFGQMVSLPSSYLDRDRRIACLSHKGLGFLAKRVLSFQLRGDFSITSAQTYTAGQWQEAHLMEVWEHEHGSLDGYTNWLQKDIVQHPLDQEVTIRRAELLEGRPDLLMEMLTKTPVEEPD